jgi:hypothetical protein
MPWKLSMQLLDDSNVVLIGKDVVISRENWRVPLKMEMASFEVENPTVDWKRFSAILEKV